MTSSRARKPGRITNKSVPGHGEQAREDQGPRAHHVLVCVKPFISRAPRRWAFHRNFRREWRKLNQAQCRAQLFEFSTAQRERQ
jgi:hypothetical protein